MSVDQAALLEHIRSGLATATERPVYLVSVPPYPDQPYVILYVIPISTRPRTPLMRDAGWRAEIQATAVGRNMTDASWMIGKVDEHFRALPAPDGLSDLSVETTVSPVVGASEGVTTLVQRWMVQA